MRCFIHLGVCITQVMIIQISLRISSFVHSQSYPVLRFFDACPTFKALNKNMSSWLKDFIRDIEAQVESCCYNLL